MGLMAMLCKFVAKHMNLHAIPDRTNKDDIYLARYHTTDDQKEARWFLHNIKRPDYEEYAHNHPYRWQLSFILSGSYDEEYLEGLPDRDGHPSRRLSILLDNFVRKRRCRFFNWIPNDRYHRITKLHGDVWTLFIHGPKHGKSWGFWLPGIGHVHNELMERYWEWQSRTREQSSVNSLPN